MESPHDFDAVHRDHEPLTAWSPGFSRSKPFEPPKGGTPNQPRFMESPVGLATLNRSESPSTALRAPSAPLEEKDGMRGFGSCLNAIADASECG